MKIFLFLIFLLRNLLMPISRNIPYDIDRGMTVTREKTTYATADEWMDHENLLLRDLQKKQHNQQDLTMKLENIQIHNGIRWLTLSVPHDMTGDQGNTIYEKGLVTVFINDGYLYVISGNP